MIFTKLGVWFKKHTLLTIVIGVIVVGGIITNVILFDGNIFDFKPDSLSVNSNKDNTSGLSNTKSNNILQDGTYSCELMYNGKSLDNDEIIKSWIKKLATYENSIEVDKININDFKKGLFDEFGSSYIVKEKNIVKLNLNNGNESVEYILYDVNNNQLNLNEELYDNEDENTWNIVKTILNNVITIKQSKDSFTYGNFGFILIYPTIINDNLNKGTSINNIDYDIYTDLGDLVCQNKL